MSELIDIFFHIDEVLKQVAAEHGGWLLLLLFVIVFCETGLVVTPMLPGDSLLFAVGALAAQGSIQLWLSSLLLITAAVGGDSLNYLIGMRYGRCLFYRGWRILSLEHLQRCEVFYAQNGPKAVVMGRFLPVFRNIVPFVAGVSRMPYRRFVHWSVLGSIVWVLTFSGCGYLFGSIPIVQRHFEVAVVSAVAIILATSLLFSWLRGRATYFRRPPEAT